MSRYSRYTANDSSTGDYVNIISRMLFDEPAVNACIRTLQNNCMRHGILLRWGNGTPPTPIFAAHIRDVWEPFCREAIVAFLAVGFAPYRIRRTVGNHMVPEVLPLGTYSWTIARARSTDAQQRKRPRVGDPSPPPPTHAFGGPSPSDPLLRYEVTSTYTDDTIHVFTFCQPHATFNCFSPLASLIPHYVALLHQRDRAARAEEWNAKPNFVLQEAQKATINDVANVGGAITGAAHGDMWSLNCQSSARQVRVTRDMLNEQRAEAGFPDHGSVLVAPKNTTAHSLDKADPPVEMGRRELHFARCAAQALGVPPAFVLQGSAAIGSSAASGGSGGWHDSPEVLSRDITDTCIRINRALEGLLSHAYHLIYGALPDYRNPPPGTKRMPHFTIPIAPILPLEQIISLFDAQLLDDDAYSRLFEVCLGYPMAKEQALKARADRHRAVNVLPFRDKKDAPSH